MGKSTFLLAFLSSLFFSMGQINAQNDPRTFEMQEGDTTYVMKQYVMVMLMRGDNAGNFTDPELEEMQQAHLDNINRLAKEGIIQVAGPMGEDENLRGIFILDVGTIEEAKKYVDTDPAVKAGRLKAEYHTWWTSKGSCID